MIAILRFFLLFAVLGACVSCSSLKDPPAMVKLEALAPATEGVLAEVSGDVRRRFGNQQSGFVLLKTNQDALDWRLALVDHAQQSIDLQYYIWKADASGALLFERLLDAAERGVRVRLLIDDFPFAGKDERIAALSHHPNFEVKIFNPGKVRKGIVAPLLNFVVNYGELNRRMHNKAFIVDNRMAIVGGRNIGNDYFGLDENYNFIDLDVLTAGAIVPEISDGFDVFWNSDAVFPGKGLSPSTGPDDTDAAIAAMREMADGLTLPAANAGYAMTRRDWSKSLRGLGDRWHGGTAGYYYDAPVVANGEERSRFLTEIPPLVDQEQPRELLISSPYLLPGEGFLDLLGGYGKKAAPVRILAPSMAANDTALVHSHYRKYRDDILRHGAELYEFRADGTEEIYAIANAPGIVSQSVGLHMKTFVGDRNTSFIGSLNMDPRSIKINTEGGLRIESASLAEELAQYLEQLMDGENSWQVTFADEADEGSLRWQSRGEVRRIQPAPGPWARVLDALYGWLPVESQL